MIWQAGWRSTWTWRRWACWSNGYDWGSLGRHVFHQMIIDIIPNRNFQSLLFWQSIIDLSRDLDFWGSRSPCWLELAFSAAMLDLFRPPCWLPFGRHVRSLSAVMLDPFRLPCFSSNDHWVLSSFAPFTLKYLQRSVIKNR